MRMNIIKIDDNHWTTEYIPISYKNILSENHKKNSLTFYWSKEYILYALCRVYFIDDYTIEIGDVWLNEKLRGKKIKDEKISVIFMRRVIKKIWKIYDKAKIINLIVDKNNISAIKLYNKLDFFISNFDNLLKLNNGIVMSKLKN